MEQFDINDLLEKAIHETDEVSLDQVFIVRDLFKGYKWNQIPRNQRLLLGTLFLNAVNSGKVELEILEKTSSGQQRYRKPSV